NFNPLNTATLRAELESLSNTQLILRFLANRNHITGTNLIRRYVYGIAVNSDGLVRNQLTGFGASSTVAHAVYDVVQTAFEQLQQVLTCCALTAGSFFVVTAELTLKYTVNTTNFL